MIKTYCDKCGREIKNNNPEIYIKQSNYSYLCDGFNFKGTLCIKCQEKLKRIIKYLAYRYGLSKF